MKQEIKKLLYDIIEAINSIESFVARIDLDSYLENE